MIYENSDIDDAVAGIENLLCLAYDDKQKKYYELESEGRLVELHKNIHR